MPDYNPDREGWRKKKYVIQKAWPGYTSLDKDAPDIHVPTFDQAVPTGKGELKPDKYGRFTTSDEKLAREIQQQYPRDYVVSRIYTDARERQDHKSVFTVPELPFHKKKGQDDEEGDEEYNGEGIA